MSETKKDDSSIGWVDDIASMVRDETRSLLKDYAGVPADKIIDHIDKTVSNTIRKCLGSMAC